MPDREKVVSIFEKIISVCKEDGCDFVDLSFEDAEQILALLKEQEAVEPQLSMSGLWYECPVCHRHLLKNRDNYCARCGKAVKWE